MKAPPRRWGCTRRDSDLALETPGDLRERSFFSGVWAEARVEAEVGGEWNEEGSLGVCGSCHVKGVLHSHAYLIPSSTQIVSRHLPHRVPSPGGH